MSKAITVYRFNKETRNILLRKFGFPEDGMGEEQYGLFIVEVPDLDYPLLMNKTAIKQNFKFDEADLDALFFTVEPRTVKEYLELIS